MLDHQIPHATLILSFFKLYVTHWDHEGRPEGWIVHMVSFELQVYHDHRDANPF